MPTPNPTLRREYKGAAAATALVNPMTNTDISFVLVAANNWPTGSVGKFIVTINRGQADEEKILCDSQTTRTVACLLANRGFDGTTAQSHAAGATVECTISAFDADEWNQHTNASTGVHGVATVAGLTETQSLTNKTLPSPVVSGTVTGGATYNGVTLDAASTVGGVSGTTLAADRTAWTAFTPTLTAITLGNGTLTADYKQFGKRVDVRFSLIVGTTTVIGSNPSFTLPVNAVTAGPTQALAGVAWHTPSGNGYAIAARVNHGNTQVALLVAQGNISPTNPFAWATGDELSASGSYEAA